VGLMREMIAEKIYVIGEIAQGRREVLLV
jgi:hypothetical protein